MSKRFALLRSSMESTAETAGRVSVPSQGSLLKALEGTDNDPRTNYAANCAFLAARGLRKIQKEVIPTLEETRSTNRFATSTYLAVLRAYLQRGVVPLQRLVELGRDSLTEVSEVLNGLRRQTNAALRELAESNESLFALEIGQDGDWCSYKLK